MAVEPLANLGMLVRGMVVENRMDKLVARHIGIDGSYTTVALRNLPDWSRPDHVEMGMAALPDVPRKTGRTAHHQFSPFNYR